MQLSRSFGLLSALVLLSFAAIAADHAEKFDLQFWKLQLPTDDNKDGKVDEIDVRQLGK